MSKIEIKGLDRLINEMNKAPKVISEGITNMLSTVGSLIESEMVQEAPNDRGELRRSIYKKVTKRKEGISMSVQPNVSYALDLHEGTKRLRGHEDMGQRGVSRVRTVWLDRFKGNRSKMIGAFANMSIAPNKFVDRTAELVQPKVDKYIEESINKIIQSI